MAIEGFRASLGQLRWFHRLRIVAVVGLLLFAPRAHALDFGSPDKLLSVEIHGFVSQGFIVTTGNNYLATNSQRGSFEFTEGGLNLTKNLTDKLRVGLQLFTRKLGPVGNFDVKLDWFYLDYRLKDWFGIRAGRVKLPFGLYNDTSDIDAARVPVLLPQSVYPTLNRDFLLAQTGAELYGYIRMGPAGGLEYRIYGGTIFVDLPQTTPGSPFQIDSFTVPFVAGGRLLWDTPVEGLRLAGSVQGLRLDTRLLAPMAGPVTARINAFLAVGSIEYTRYELTVAAEYSRWYLDSESSNTDLFPAIPTIINERMYGLVAYRVTRWFHPAAYYSLYFPNVRQRGLTRADYQHDLAATLRFDINSFWLVKLEGHYLVGTADLQSSLNEGRPLIELTRSWANFLIKTTVYF